MAPPTHSFSAHDPEEGQLDRLLHELVIAARVAPAASAAVAWLEDGCWVTRLGAAGAIEGVPVRFDTPFDLASVTKPATALLCAKLVDEGVVEWGTRLTKYLPELAGAPAATGSLEAHLSHRAGLVAHRELFVPLREGRPFARNPALWEAATARRDGDRDTALYSDLGYVLAGEALGRALGTPLDLGVVQHLGLPEIGSSRQWQQRDPGFLARVAPSEVVAWRGGQLRGVVHDDNAWALAGHGSAGHAGLFGTALGVLGLGMAMLDSLRGRGLVRAETASALVRPRPGGSLRMGFDSKSGPESMAGRVAGPNTFGHLGFTGTSLWCDPDVGVATVLLTNRVCPTQQNRAIRIARPKVHDALFQVGRARALGYREKGPAGIKSAT